MARAAIRASHEHPSRIIVHISTIRSTPTSWMRNHLGGDTSASEMIVLRGWGGGTDRSTDLGLLLPSSPIGLVAALGAETRHSLHRSYRAASHYRLGACGGRPRKPSNTSPRCSVQATPTWRGPASPVARSWQLMERTFSPAAAWSCGVQAESRPWCCSLRGSDGSEACSPPLARPSRGCTAASALSVNGSVTFPPRHFRGGHLHQPIDWVPVRTLAECISEELRRLDGRHLR